MGLGLVVGALGVVISGSCRIFNHPMSLLKIMQEELSGPPFHVAIELILGLVLSMWAALTVPAKFLSINPDSEENRIVSFPANLDFMVFNHRGKLFPQQLDFKLKH